MFRVITPRRSQVSIHSRGRNPYPLLPSGFVVLVRFRSQNRGITPHRGRECLTNNSLSTPSLAQLAVCVLGASESDMVDGSRHHQELVNNNVNNNLGCSSAMSPRRDEYAQMEDQPTLTSIRHVCVVDPKQGTVFTMVVVPSMFCLVTFNRNV